MLAILPEIYKSGIWKKYSSSIFEYAGKYGDIAKTTVIKRLRLEENLVNLPALKGTIEKVGVHKVAMVTKNAKPSHRQMGNAAILTAIYLMKFCIMLTAIVKLKVTIQLSVSQADLLYRKYKQAF